MDLESFCVRLSTLDLTQPQQAVAILWFADKQEPDTKRTPGELSRSIRDAGLGNPHSTKLGEAIVKTRHVLKSGKSLKIKPTSRDIVRGWVESILAPEPPSVDQEHGYIPEPVWHGTRGYITKVAEQVNACFQFGMYNGAAILTRRLIETLLIECFEHKGIADRIKDADDNYISLSRIIGRVVDHRDIRLSKDSRKALTDIRKSGNRSAHNHRYLANKGDLSRIQADVRVAVEELLQLVGESVLMHH